MKKINKLLFMVVVLAGFFSCTKDENKNYLEGGTPPVLSASQTTSIPLSFANRDKEAIRITWTNPAYQFTTGVSSQDVSYQLEIDTVGANFTNPKRQTIAISKDLSRTLMQGELNDYLLNQLQLTPSTPHQIEIRVTSSLNNAAARLASNTLKFAVTPFAIPPKVTPPASGKLFITGGATPASWQCGCGEAELASQKFEQRSPTLYVLPSINLKAGESYLFLPVYGSWAAKYGFTGGGNANNVDVDDFRDGGNDIKAPGVTGNYKIEVDFQRGKFTVTKL
ncbi:MAG: SusE domain-containing protein [Chitinophagaceae bacterium]